MDSPWRYAPTAALDRVVAGVATILLAGTIASNAAPGLRTLRGQVPSAVARFHLRPIGVLSGTNRLNLAIGLPLQNQPALTALLQQLYDPASPNYRRYLTPVQFTERFGPSSADYQAVMTFVKTNGLAVMGAHSDRLLLDVSGRVADIERAFHLTLRIYRHPTENRTFYAPDTEPSVPSQLPVLDIIGLDNFARPHPLFKQSPSGQGTGARPAVGSGPSGSYRGYDFRAAYAPGVTLDGSGQTVGLFEEDGYYSNDIASYESQASLPRVPLQNVLLDGFNGQPTSDAAQVEEVSLDIEMATSMAPGLSNIVVFEAPFTFGAVVPDDILDAMAASNQIKQFSSSWGWVGGPNATTDNIFQKMAAQGQSFFGASGDIGAYDSTIDQTNLFNVPSDSPYVTSVGGTALTTSGPSGAWASETVWNYIGQSSGGVSTYYSIPYWQANVDMTSNGGSTSHRNIPDVALTAENIFVVYNNGQQDTSDSGTSAAAPLWAGFTALVNQEAAAHSRAPVGFLNPALYAIGTEGRYLSDFHDITTGNNTNNFSPTNFFAVPGYDLCTGWGTPAGQNLIDDLALGLDALAITPTLGFSASGPATGPFDITSQNLVLTNLGATPLNWSLGGVPFWLDVSPSGGALDVGGQTVVTVSLNGAATNLWIGSYSSTVRFTNQTSGVVLTRLFTLRVLPPHVTALPLHLFSALSSATNKDGASPNRGLVFSGDTLYGTTVYGGAWSHGTVFRMNTGTGFTNLHSFTAVRYDANNNVYSNSDGAQPPAGLVLSGDTLYGTTAYGGTWGYGTVFRMNTDGMDFTNLHSFAVEGYDSSHNAFTNGDGAQPLAGVVLSGGVLYGTTSVGGISGGGTIFRLDTDGMNFTNLHTFSGGTDGSAPQTELVLSGNTLYGTASGGGASGNGTVFSLNTDGTGFTNLHAFTAVHQLSLNVYTNTDGAEPLAGLVLSGGILYGTTELGGAAGNGVLFRLNPDGTGFTNLFSFHVSLSGTGGIYPVGRLVVSGDVLFGTTTSSGYSGSGTVFGIRTDGTGFADLHDFTAVQYDSSRNVYTNSDGADSLGGLVLSGNTLYGTASKGGRAGNGAVFSLLLGEVTPPPQLAIGLSAENMILSWPSTATGFVLQTNSDLATTNWGDYSGNISTNGILESASVKPSAGNLFFRLSNQAP